MGASFQDRASRAAHGALAGLRHPATIACAYGAIALATFGHECAQYDRFYVSNCSTAEDRVDTGNACYGSTTLRGIGAAVLWPLYWSWELQS